jgi:hypothetical protein
LWLFLPAHAGAQEAPTAGAEATDATKLRCAHAFEMSQRARQDGKLQEARAQALVCAQADCPALLSGDCTTWLAELEGAIASVVVEVRDGHGQAVPSAQVSVDGAPLTQSLDGRALPVDPGERHFAVVLPSGERLERTLVVTEGKKGQYLRFDAAPSVAPPPRVPARRLSPWAYGAAAASVMGGVGFAYFGLQGRAEENRLDDACSPRCPSSDVSALERTYLAADVSLGVGVAAFGVLSYLWLTSGAEPQRAVGATASSAGASLSYRQSF